MTTTLNGRAMTMQAALAYLHAGLSVIPIRDDGSKAPAVPWDRYQDEPATEADLQEWFADGRFGVGVVGGKVSGNLEHLDFDTDAEVIFPEWCELVEAEAPGLVARLSVRRTPSGGYHASYRCHEVAIPGNSKLAVRPDPSSPRKRQTLIETRGEGGQCVAPGTPAHCHQTGRVYEHHSGPRLSQVGSITAAEREVLWRAAQSFDEMGEAEPVKAHNTAQAGLSPGDDYNERGPSFAELIEPYGWTAVFCRGGKTYWKRPGKDDPGWSATTGLKSKSGRELFCVFSTNAHPFPGADGVRACSTHDRFAVYTLLNHNGDFSTAAKALAEQGFGEQRKQSTSKPHGGDQGSGQAEATGHDIIVAWLLAEYEPGFRRGSSIYSNCRQREVKQSEACSAPPMDLIRRLAGAADAPRDNDGVKTHALPYFFGTWAKVAWGTVFHGLADEEEAAEVCDGAGEQFRHQVRLALLSQVTLGETRLKDGKRVMEAERRSLIDWCVRFARSGPWKSIRSYPIWTRTVATPGNPSQLEVAIRPELFGLVGCRPLEAMTLNRLTRLAERYDVGRGGDETKAQGRRCVVLAQDFLEGLLAPPMGEPEREPGEEG